MPYGLRHNFAAVGIRAGMDIASLALMMGHASRAMTLDTYGDANADALNLASVKLKDTFNDNTDYFKLEEEQEQNGQDYFNGTILEIQDSFVLVECLEVTSGAVSVGTEAQIVLMLRMPEVFPKWLLETISELYLQEFRKKTL